jgi:predicted RNA methylase
LSVATATQFAPEEVEYSLLDVHRQSIDNSKSIISKMKMEEYFEGYVCDDAVNVDLNNHMKKKPHIIVTEVMNTALMEEPQAAVTKNLVPQLENGGMIVPENVIVSAVLLTNTHKITLGKIIELTKDHIFDILNQSDINEKVITIEKSFTVPVPVKASMLVLDTDIHIFGDQKLQLSDSFITRSFPVGIVPKIKQRVKIRVKIKLGGDRSDTKFSME